MQGQLYVITPKGKKLTRSFDDSLASKTATSSDAHVEWLQENGADFWMGLQWGFLLFFPWRNITLGQRKEKRAVSGIFVMHECGWRHEQGACGSIFLSWREALRRWNRVRIPSLTSSTEEKKNSCWWNMFPPAPHNQSRSTKQRPNQLIKKSPPPSQIWVFLAQRGLWGRFLECQCS